MNRKELLTKWKEEQFKNEGAQFDADEGQWITVNGTPVCIDKEGEVTKGPKVLKDTLKDKGKAKAAVKKAKQNKEEASKKPTKVSAKVKSSSESESKPTTAKLNHRPVYVNEKGTEIEVVERKGDMATVVIDGIVSHVSMDYLMEHCKSKEMEKTLQKKTKTKESGNSPSVKSGKTESKKPKQYSNTYISDLGEKIEVLDREGDTVTALVNGKKKKLPIEYMMEHTRSHVME